ncbi:hypothetical protein ABXT06_17060 [Flavobacterium sp. UW10123]|uniref:hypothetical protein n=1 Tax=Flavobacterium sp. UW10123 TaxID=3230800 RepID=UPI0033972D0D
MKRINSKIISTLFVLFFTASVYSQTTNHFEFTLTTPMFANSMPNQAINIQFPSVRLWGWIEVTITSFYNSQLGTGKVTKRYEIGHNVGGYFSQSTEIPEAFGAIATQWYIGDFNHDTNSIPIYHLVSTNNFLVIKIEGVLTDPVNIDLIKTTTTLSSIETAVSPNARHYKSIMQDRVGIGTNSPKNKLDVNGTIHSKEVKVDMNDWSDFVFKKDYNLPTLEEVEKHIAEKGYLENIPSEAEVLQNGINLGEMNAKLLQKIEEMTLYIIEQNRQINDLNKRLKKVESK